MTTLGSAKEIVRQNGKCKGVRCCECCECCSPCYKDDTALAYIAEHEKPESDEWVGAPDWARYKATDGKGSQMWYEYPPDRESSHWAAVLGKAEHVKHLNWRESLIERPAKKWEPKEGEAVMVWVPVANYCTVVAYTKDWDIPDYNIARFDGRTDLRVSEIGDEVERLK